MTDERREFQNKADYAGDMNGCFHFASMLLDRCIKQHIDPDGCIVTLALIRHINNYFDGDFFSFS